MQFDWFLSVLEQKWLENHEIYYIGAAELPLEFTNGALNPKGDRDTSSKYVLLFSVKISLNWRYLMTCLSRKSKCHCEMNGYLSRFFCESVFYFSLARASRTAVSEFGFSFIVTHPFFWPIIYQFGTVCPQISHRAGICANFFCSNFLCFSLLWLQWMA